MIDKVSWENQELLASFLGRRLLDGQLALVLGAGASMAFGLPNWQELNLAIAKKAKVKLKSGDPTKQAAELLREYKDRELQFAGLVREALYDGFDASLSELLSRPLMPALGAIASRCSRGSVARIISYNFDDLFERYLAYYGFGVHSVANLPELTQRADTIVYHPNGLLPSRPDGSATPIVYAEPHFDARLSRSNTDIGVTLWESIITDVFLSHICIFIGLSGDDPILRTHLSSVAKAHISKPYWGVRLCGPNDPRNPTWEESRVFNLQVSDFGKIPDFLVSICQMAAGLRNQ